MAGPAFVLARNVIAADHDLEPETGSSIEALCLSCLIDHMKAVRDGQVSHSPDEEAEFRASTASTEAAKLRYVLSTLYIDFSCAMLRCGNRA